MYARSIILYSQPIKRKKRWKKTVLICTIFCLHVTTETEYDYTSGNLVCNPAILHKSHEYINDFNFYFFIDLIHFGGNSFKILHLHVYRDILFISLHIMLQLHTRNVQCFALWLIHIIKKNKSANIYT